MSSEPGTGRPTDNAFLGPLKGGSLEVAYAGALSFMRRRYSRDLPASTSPSGACRSTLR